MLKTELTTAIDSMQETQKIVFLEQLDSGESNRRFMNCSKQELLNVLEFFDDNLYGHVRDFVYTTIVGYELVNE